MDIGRKIAELEARIARMENSPRLSHAAIDDTSVEVRDGSGNLRALLGVQADGTTAANIVNGPPPPQPSAPTVTPGLGGVTVSWDGTFTDGSPAPLDWARVEVHASILASYEPIPATLQGTIETAQGATVAVRCDTDVYVRLVARNTSGTASTASATVGPYGPTPVVADDIVDGIVTTAKLAEGAVNINALTASLADTAAQRYVDAMGDATAWTVLSKADTATFTFLEGVTDAPTGATVAQAAGYAIVRSTTQIAYDPDVLYRISVRLRTTAASSAGSDTLYAGLLGVGADGVTLVSRFGAAAFTNQHYVAAANASQPTASGWVTYTGYVKGRAATGTGTAAPDPRTPGTVHTNVRFVSAILYLNFASGSSGVNSGTGTMQVDAVTIEALKTGVVDGTNLVAGSVTTAALAADSVTATQIAANAVTTAKLNAGAVTTGKLEALAVTADKIAANAITVDKLAAGSVDATALAADAITGKTITGGIVRTATSGQRITLNEFGTNRIRVYNASNTVVGELSADGVGVVGENGSVLALDPNSEFPNLRLSNISGSNSAYIYLSEGVSGSADLIHRSGTFTGSGYGDMMWRTFYGNDFWVADRVRNTDTSTYIGGRVGLFPTNASVGFHDSTDSTKDAYWFLQQGLAQLYRARMEIYTPPSANPALFINADSAHTGYLHRTQLNSSDRFTVDKDGNTSIAGALAAGNIAAGRLTITPSAANTPTSANVTGLNLKGTNIRVVATAATSVPGTGVTGVGVTGQSATGFTVWVTRTNTTATVIEWIAFGV